MTADDGSMYFHEIKSGAVFWTVYLQRTSADGQLSWKNCMTGDVNTRRPPQDPLDKYTVTIDRHGAHVAPPLSETAVLRVAAALSVLPEGWEEAR